MAPDTANRRNEREAAANPDGATCPCSNLAVAKTWYYYVDPDSKA